MASLTLLRGEEEGEAFALEAAETIIGREEGCAIRIEGLGLSRRHCSVSRSGQRYLLRDLSSENGTWVNGVRISERELRHGDQVGLGVQASLRFRDETQAAELPAATGPGTVETAGAVFQRIPVESDDEAAHPVAARWLLVIALIGLAILIGILLQFSLTA